MEHPKVTIIIPVKPGGMVSALECIKWLDYPEDRIDVLVVEGRQPSRQRNEAARNSTGDILYFLDDDSCPAPDALIRIIDRMKDPTVAVVGGPSLTPEGDTTLQKAFGAALGSFLGGFTIRNRYRKTGSVRISSENELILCNLAFKKSSFLEAGGLNEALYPNEENDLMNRLQKMGYKLIHDPDLFVMRSQRRTVAAFVRQMLNYGRGRAEQTIITPSDFRVSHLVPTIFVAYLLSLMFYHEWLYLTPLIAYFLINLTSSLYLGLQAGDRGVALILPTVYTLMHVCYGTGVVWGILRGGAKRGRTSENGDVLVRRIEGIHA